MTAQPEAPPDGFLNTPPMMGPPPGMPSEPMSTDKVDALIAKATATETPEMEEAPGVIVDLPAGYITPDGILVRHAQVRELNGYDEERLSRTDMMKNVASYITELLFLGVTDLGGEKPTKKMLQELLIGDRDALVLGIRQATYGNDVEFKLHCTACDSDSVVNVQIDEDVPVVFLDDPLVRRFEVALRRGGSATVHLLTGAAQEAFSEGIDKKTQAEINTVMLAKSVVAINGKPVGGRDDDVRRLSSADRLAITDFIAEHQPGPQLNKEIEVPCATCGAEYPVLLGLPNLFRF